jgi:hypothetical protein
VPLTQGNGSNFVERFSFLKQLFDLNIEQAYRRAVITTSALKVIYKIDLPVPKIKAIGYLNEQLCGLKRHRMLWIANSTFVTRLGLYLQSLESTTT